MFGIDDVALAMLASSAIGAGASMYGASQNKSAQPGVPDRYEWANYPIRPEYQLAGDFLQRGLQRVEEGKAPVWFEQYRPQEEEYRQKKLYEQYFGGPGTFGTPIIPAQQATEVAAGRRGSPASTNIAKQYYNYSQGLNDIYNLMTNLGYQTRSNVANTYPQQLAQMYQPSQMGQFLHFGGYGGTSYQPSGLEQFGTALGATAPYLSYLRQPAASNSSSYLNDWFNANAGNTFGQSWATNPNTLASLRQPTTTALPNKTSWQTNKFLFGG
jgi:hypothetical protein